MSIGDYLLKFIKFHHINSTGKSLELPTFFFNIIRI